MTQCISMYHNVTKRRNVTKHRQCNRGESLLSKSRQLRSVVGSKLAETKEHQKHSNYQQESKDWEQQICLLSDTYLKNPVGSIAFHSTIPVQAAAHVQIRKCTELHSTIEHGMLNVRISNSLRYSSNQKTFILNQREHPFTIFTHAFAVVRLQQIQKNASDIL